MLFVPLAAAEKGVGIMWSTQSEVVKEGQLNCVNYTVYNPFDEDANIYMTASSELESLVEDTTPILVPAGTTHDMGIPVSLCFDIPKQTCATEVTYTGDVLAVEKSTSESGADAAGSATRAMASAPLTLKVTCPPSEINWTLMLIVAAVAIVLVAAFVLMRKKK